MSTTRIVPIFSTFILRPISRVGANSIIKQQSRTYASSSYGGAGGDPKADNPQSQGSNPSADQEHPGPPPPAAGQGTGGGPTKADKDGHNTQQNDSSSSGRSNSGSSVSGASSGAKPKIHSINSPPEPNEDVRRHNEEHSRRHDRSETRSEEDSGQKVDKGFWSGKIGPWKSIIPLSWLTEHLGHGGADRNP